MSHDSASTDNPDPQTDAPRGWRERFSVIDTLVALTAAVALISPFVLRPAVHSAPMVAERAEIAAKPIVPSLDTAEAALAAAPDRQRPDNTTIAVAEPTPDTTVADTSPEVYGELLAFADDLESVAFDADDIQALRSIEPETPAPASVTIVAPEPLPAPVSVPEIAELSPLRTPLPPLHPAHKPPAPRTPVLPQAEPPASPPVIAEKSLAPLPPEQPASEPEMPAQPVETVVVQMDAPGSPKVTRSGDAPAEPTEPTRVAMAETAVAKPGSETKTDAEPEIIAQKQIRIALVVTAAGLNADVTRFAIDALPAGITLAFAPVKPDVGALAAEAKADGHTVLVEIPMEPINRRRDPGAMTLRVSNPVAENLDNLEEALARVPAASGASSYLGARFNAVEGAAGPIVQALTRRGFFFFENQPKPTSVLERIARRSNLPYAKGHVVIDRAKSPKSITAALNALEKRAQRGGVAIGVGSALRGTISTVELWAKEAQKRGVIFVPITEARQ